MSMHTMTILLCVVVVVVFEFTTETFADQVNSNQMVITNSGVMTPSSSDVALVFFTTLRNNAEKTVGNATYSMDRCCFQHTELDEPSCLKLHHTSDDLKNGGTVQSKIDTNITVIYPTMYTYDRSGFCDFSLFANGSQLLGHTIKFNTSFGGEAWIPYFITKIFKAPTGCASPDLDRLRDCIPVNCVLKYNGIRNWFNTTSQLCEPQTNCLSDPAAEIPTRAFNWRKNKCRDLHVTLTKADIEAFEGDMIEASFKSFNLMELYQVVCVHGKEREGGTGCICDDGWTSSPIDHNNYDPSIRMVFMCNIEDVDYEGTSKHSNIIVSMLVLVIICATLAVCYLLLVAYDNCYRKYLKPDDFHQHPYMPLVDTQQNVQPEGFMKSPYQAEEGEADLVGKLDDEEGHDDIDDDLGFEEHREDEQEEEEEEEDYDENVAQHANPQSLETSDQTDHSHSLVSSRPVSQQTEISLGSSKMSIMSKRSSAKQALLNSSQASGLSSDKRLQYGKWGPGRLPFVNSGKSNSKEYAYQKLSKPQSLIASDYSVNNSVRSVQNTGSHYGVGGPLDQSNNSIHPGNSEWTKDSINSLQNSQTLTGSDGKMSSYDDSIVHGGHIQEKFFDGSTTTTSEISGTADRTSHQDSTSTLPQESSTMDSSSFRGSEETKHSIGFAFLKKFIPRMMRLNQQQVSSDQVNETANENSSITSGTTLKMPAALESSRSTVHQVSPHPTGALANVMTNYDSEVHLNSSSENTNQDICSEDEELDIAFAKVIIPNDPILKEELVLSLGDRITGVKSTNRQGMWMGVLNGTPGYFPRSCVEFYNHAGELSY